jgi:hypothetical protein
MPARNCQLDCLLSLSVVGGQTGGNCDDDTRGGVAKRWQGDRKKPIGACGKSWEHCRWLPKRQQPQAADLNMNHFDSLPDNCGAALTSTKVQSKRLV